MWDKETTISKCVKYSNYSNNFILEAKKKKKKAKKTIGDNYNNYLL